MQWAANLELEREEASGSKANVLETPCVLQILDLTAEEISVKTGWPNLPESVNTERPKEAAESLP